MTAATTRSAVISELGRGLRTTDELMAVTGLSRNAVSCALRNANAAGYRVFNHRRPGGHGLYELQVDPERPELRRCAIPGCERPLSRSNATRYCRLHLPDVAYLLYLVRLSSILDELLGETSEEKQLQLA